MFQNSNHSDERIRANEDSRAKAWFPEICKTLLPHKAGDALHHLTGFSVRSCQQWAKGDARVPGDAVRSILRSDEGRPWLDLIMADSSAFWWQKLVFAEYALLLEKEEDQ